MKETESDFIRANLATVERMLADLAPSDIVSQANLEDWRDELRVRLTILDRERRAPERIEGKGWVAPKIRRLSPIDLRDRRTLPPPKALMDVAPPPALARTR